MDCFTEIYDVPGFWVHFGTCADSVYQALFSGLGTRLYYGIASFPASFPMFIEIHA